MTNHGLAPGLAKTVSVLAGAGALAVLAMIGISIANGVGFQDFESILKFGNMPTYNEMIAKAAPVLRTIYPIDTVYVLCYTVMTFSIIQLAPDKKLLGILAAISVSVVAILDFVENNHIIAMANAVERGYEIPYLQVITENVITQVKFNSGLMLTLALSFLFPDAGRVSTVAKWLARITVVFAPVALLTPLTTLIYLTMNIVLAAMISFIYARFRAQLLSTRPDGLEVTI